MFEKILELLHPQTKDWNCRYWRLYDAERFNDSFASHNEAHEFAEEKRKLGYLTLVFQNEDPEEPVDLLSGLLSVLSSGSISGALKSLVGLLKNILKHHTPKG